MEIFEDGMESDFSLKIIDLLKENTPQSRQQIEAIILDEQKPEEAGEALRWIGRIECFNSRGFCLRMLEAGIKSPHVKVRDGALLGLSSIGGFRALFILERAANRETRPELLEDMRQAIQELKEQIRLSATGNSWS